MDRHIVVTVAAAALTSLLLFVNPTTGQQSRSGLQTRVADLETRVAILERGGAASNSSPTPATAEASSGIQENRSRFLVGRVSGGLPEGEPGLLDAVLVGGYSPDRELLPFLVRNNTNEQVSNISATVTVRSPSGELLASGASLMDIKPASLAPGEYGIGYALVEGGGLPTDATFEVDLETRPASDLDPVDLGFAEIGITEARIVGVVQNTSSQESSFPSVLVLCFDSDSDLVSSNNVPLSNPSLGPGETVSFQFEARDAPCEAFLAAAS